MHVPEEVRAGFEEISAAFQPDNFVLQAWGIAQEPDGSWLMGLIGKNPRLRSPGSVMAAIYRCKPEINHQQGVFVDGCTPDAKVELTDAGYMVELPDGKIGLAISVVIGNNCLLLL